MQVKLSGQKVLPWTSMSGWPGPCPSTAAATSGTEMWNSIFLGPVGFGFSNTSEGCSAGALRAGGKDGGRKLRIQQTWMIYGWFLLFGGICLAKSEMFHSQINMWPGDVIYSLEADFVHCS